jgi:putative GTP pyrophosphokinase
MDGYLVRRAGYAGFREAQLTDRPKRNFPGGSKKRVTRAGDRFRRGEPTGEDFDVINIWREAHRHVINSFQAILRNRTRGTDVVVVQRHKRIRTIIDKLDRFQQMQLGRMDDVAGCRLIFDSVDQLQEFRNDFLGVNQRVRFNHKVLNDPEKYDYIKNPKDSGYRGIHDIYEYDVRSEQGRDLQGLLIELQYRTIYQHAWATAVEVVGFVTENQPKFDHGDYRYREILRLASEIIARAFEDRHSCLPELTGEEVVERFTELDNELHFLGMLRGLNAADRDISDEKNIILLFKEGATEGEEELEVKTYSSATDALRALFKLERDNPDMDIVLVKGERPEYVREAFKNYFSDARQFIDLINEGCSTISEKRILTMTRSEDGKITLE